MSGVQSQGLLPANTTLLQPASGYFRLYDALRLLSDASAVTSLSGSVQTLQGQVASLQISVTSLQNQINTINNTLSSLQTQINTINTRLANAGIP